MLSYFLFTSMAMSYYGIVQWELRNSHLCRCFIGVRIYNAYWKIAVSTMLRRDHRLKSWCWLRTFSPSSLKFNTIVFFFEPTTISSIRKYCLILSKYCISCAPGCTFPTGCAWKKKVLKACLSEHFWNLMLARAHLRLEKSSSFAMRVRYLARPTNSLSVPLFLCASLQMAFQLEGNILHLCAVCTWKPWSWGPAGGSWGSSASSRQTWSWSSCHTEGTCPRSPPEASHQQSRTFLSELRSLLWSPDRRRDCSLDSCHSQAVSSFPQSTSCWLLTWSFWLDCWLFSLSNLTKCKCHSWRRLLPGTRGDMVAWVPTLPQPLIWAQIVMKVIDWNWIGSTVWEITTLIPVIKESVVNVKNKKFLPFTPWVYFFHLVANILDDYILVAFITGYLLHLKC